MPFPPPPKSRRTSRCVPPALFLILGRPPSANAETLPCPFRQYEQPTPAPVVAAYSDPLPPPVRTVAPTSTPAPAASAGNVKTWAVTVRFALAHDGK